MGFYTDRVFPLLLDWTMRAVNDLRAPALAAATGDVLEVGFGTGLNLPYYPSAVRRLVALDPLRALERRVARRVAAARFPVERVALAADQRLPFEDASFDSVVTTFTLCSIPDPAVALAEMRRVLRPGGVYLFLEHGRSDDPKVARRQERWEPIQRRIAGGCHLSRPIDRLVRAAGFDVERLERFVQPHAPRILAEMYRGAGRRA